MMVFQTIGAAASAAWAEQHGLDTSTIRHWYVEITVPTDEVDTSFEINIYREEWGVIFRHGDRVSSIRVTDQPFVHGVDEHRLLPHLPELDNIGGLLSLLERRHEMSFLRTKATIHSNLTRAREAVREWLVGQR